LAALLENHCDAEVELVKSGGGVFEVMVEGELVYSKKETGSFPDEMQLLKQIAGSSLDL